MKRSAGFTLVELLITITLFSLASAVLAGLYISGGRQYREESIRNDLSKGLTTLSDELTTDIQNAYAIEASYGGYASGTSTIVLDVPAIDANQNLVMNGTSFVADRVIYNLNGSSVLKSVIPGAGSARSAATNKTVASKVISFSLTYSPALPASSQVSWAVSARDSYQNRIVNVSSTRTSKLRNHS
jgi:prepilin-type N-terminal cleavage/methylation domain-containing protein